jgi:hypothetical protein
MKTEPVTEEASSSAAKDPGELDFVDLALYGGIALFVFDLLGAIPIFGYVLEPLGLALLKTIFWLKGVQVKSMNILMMTGMGLEVVPVVSEFLPSCTAFVITVFVMQKVEKRAAAALAKAAPAAEIAKKIPVPQVAAAGAAVSAANKVVNKGQSVGSAVGSEAAGLAASKVGVAGGRAASAGASVSGSVSGQAAGQAGTAAGKPKNATGDLTPTDTPYAEGSPLVEGSPYPGMDPDAMSLEQRARARRTLQAKEEELFKQFQQKNTEKGPNSTQESQKIWAEREKAMKEYGRFTSTEEGMIKLNKEKMNKADLQGDVGGAMFAQQEIARLENEFFQKQRQRFRSKMKRDRAA